MIYWIEGVGLFIICYIFMYYKGTYYLHRSQHVVFASGKNKLYHLMWKPVSKCKDILYASIYIWTNNNNHTFRKSRMQLFLNWKETIHVSWIHMHISKSCSGARTNITQQITTAVAKKMTHPRTNTSRHVLMALTAMADAHICSKMKYTRVHVRTQTHTGVSYKSETCHIWLL